MGDSDLGQCHQQLALCELIPTPVAAPLRLLERPDGPSQEDAKPQRTLRLYLRNSALPSCDIISDDPLCDLPVKPISLRSSTVHVNMQR